MAHPCVIGGCDCDLDNPNALTSANHWNALANEQDRMAAWEASIGHPHGFNPSYGHRAATYRHIAIEQAMEAETGAPWCATHLEPRATCQKRHGL